MRAVVKTEQEIRDISFADNIGFCFIMRGCAFSYENLKHCGKEIEVESLYGKDKHNPNDLVYYSDIEGERERCFFPLDTIILSDTLK